MSITISITITYSW